MAVNREFHDLSELRLNRGGEAWGNLGYWQEGDDYSDACRRLALKLGEAAELDKNSIMFDAGFGCGDQILLWQKHFGVADIHGANLSQSQTEFAQNRIETAALICGDIDNAAVWPKRKVSHIMALDCVYHFPDWERFLERSYERLTRGGTLVMTDFVIAGSKAKSSWILKMMLKASRIPKLITEDDYRHQLRRAGFDNVSFENISEPVMLGFSDWTKRVKPKGLKYRLTGWFLGWAYRNNLLGYYLICAAID